MILNNFLIFRQKMGSRARYPLTTTESSMSTVEAINMNDPAMINDSSTLEDAFGDNPAEGMIKMIISECSKAAVQGLGEVVALEQRSEEDDGESGNAWTILATATVCFGLRVADCYVVRLYRHLKKWELGLTDEQRGNLKIKSHLISEYTRGYADVMG